MASYSQAKLASVDRYQEVVDRLSVIKRYLVPAQSDDWIPGRPRCWGLAPQDFELVVGGFACSSCLACWAPAVLSECPACGEQRQGSDQVVERPDWAELEAHRQQELANPTKTRLKPAHQIAEELSAEALEGHMPGVKKNL